MSDLAAAVRRAASRALDRVGLSSAIVAALEELGAPAESAAAARRIAEPGSVVVVAGQQPVLLGGPGLVWAKACDAIALARAIETEHGVPAVAVFWNASEDHDHAECDHVRMDLGSEVETLRVPLPGDRRMLSRVPVPEAARDVLDLLRTGMAPGASRDEILSSAEPAAGDTMGSWFSRILLRLLGRHGLVVVEPQTLRRFAREVVDFEISRPGELAASVRRAEAAAAALGEPPSLELVRDELLFFVDAAGRRLRVARDGGRWSVEDGRALTSSELRDLPPGAFSWNVAARVVAQNAALPVAAQVCGPSEIRYCARLGEAHELLGIPCPLLVRRSQWTFVTARASRLCRELGVDAAAVAEGLDAIDLVTPQSGVDLAGLRAAVAALPSQGSAAVQRRHAALVQGVASYAEALQRDAAERDSVRLDRRRRALALLRPEGEPQDRRLSPLSFVARAGTAFLDEALRRTSRDIALHPDGRSYVFNVDERSGATA